MFVIHLLTFIVLMFYIIKLTAKKKKIIIDRFSISYYAFFLIWIAFSLISYLWAKNGKTVIMQSFNIVNSLFTFFLIVQVINSLERFKKICLILAVIYVMFIITGLIEIFTWNHFQESKAFQDKLITFVPYGPFYNQNDFAAALLLLTPIVLFLIKNTKILIFKIVLSICISLSVIFFFIQGARIAIIIFSLIMVLYFLYYLKMKGKVILLTVIILVTVWANIQFPLIFDTLRMTANQEYQSIVNDQESYRTTSIKIRCQLIKIALQMAYQSRFIGVGSGNFPENMENHIIKTSKVRDAHNYLLEILASNGLLIFLMLILLMFIIHINLFRIKVTDSNLKNLKYAMIYTSFVLYSVFLLPSSMRNYFWHWIMIGLLVAFINIQHNKKLSDEY